MVSSTLVTFVARSIYASVFSGTDCERLVGTPVRKSSPFWCASLRKYCCVAALSGVTPVSGSAEACKDALALAPPVEGRFEPSCDMRLKDSLLRSRYQQEVSFFGGARRRITGGNMKQLVPIEPRQLKSCLRPEPLDQYVAKVHSGHPGRRSLK